MNCIPFLSYDDATGAIDWLEQGVRVRAVVGARGCRTARSSHAELRFGDGMIMLGSAGPNPIRA